MYVDKKLSGSVGLSVNKQRETDWIYLQRKTTYGDTEQRTETSGARGGLRETERERLYRCF